MGLNSFFTAFLFILLTELGDKTQLAVITLSSKYGWRSVVSGAMLGDKTQLAAVVLAAEYTETILIFLGVISAFLVITIIGALIGKGIIHLVPQQHLRLISTLLFTCFGLVFSLQAIVFT